MTEFSTTFGEKFGEKLIENQGFAQFPQSFPQGFTGKTKNTVEGCGKNFLCKIYKNLLGQAVDDCLKTVIFRILTYKLNEYEKRLRRD